MRKVWARHNRQDLKRRALNAYTVGKRVRDVISGLTATMAKPEKALLPNDRKGAELCGSCSLRPMPIKRATHGVGDGIPRLIEGAAQMWTTYQNCWRSRRTNKERWINEGKVDVMRESRKGAFGSSELPKLYQL